MHKKIDFSYAVLIIAIIGALAAFGLVKQSERTEQAGMPVVLLPQTTSVKETVPELLLGGWKTISGGFAEEIDFRISDGKNVFAYYQSDDQGGPMRLQEECSWNYENTTLSIKCPGSGFGYFFDKVSVSGPVLNLSSSTSNVDSGTYERIPQLTSSSNIEEQELTFCKKQGFYIPDSTTDFHPKVTQLSTSGEVLVDCYANNVGTSLSLYIAKISNDGVQKLWFFPAEADASIQQITAIQVQDIDKDGSDEITFGTYGHGGSCSWYDNTVNVYSLKMRELFSKSVNANADASCMKYEKSTTTYSETIHQANSQIRKFIDSVILEQKWQS